MPIRYLIELDSAGHLLKPTLTDTADPSLRGARRGRSYLAPSLRRTMAVSPLLLADNATYLLGIPKGESEREVDRAAVCHKAFTDLIADCARAAPDPDVAAVAAFYDAGGPAGLSLGEGFDPSANLTFSIDGRLPIDSGTVKNYWATRMQVQANVMQCVVCGRRRPALERLQTVIKGIPGGQSSGTSIISFNESGYESYGLEASLNAPICADCAERSHHALNTLLRDQGHRLIVGDAVLVCWTREDAPFSFLDLLERPDAEEVRRLMLSPYGGRAAPVEANRFYATLLGAGGSRVQVRSWLDATVDDVQRNLARWFARQRIVGPWGEDPQPLGVRSLAAATVRDLKELPPHAIASLYLAALNDQAVPLSLAFSVVARTRAEQTVQHNHAAVLKLALCGRHPELEDTMAQLDLSNTAPAYLCGRLLAELEQAQHAASPGVKASIVDRYYGTACTAPATVFGTLIQNAQTHLAKLNRDRHGAYLGIQATLEGILAALDGFPATLTLNEQSLFALGYYHQRAHNRARAIAHNQEAQS
jgi:CRISPR-associated protein Csd1